MGCTRPNSYYHTSRQDLEVGVLVDLSARILENRNRRCECECGKRQ